MTGDIAGEYGLSRETTDCVAGPTVHLTRDANSSMDQGEISAIAMQQGDSGRSGGSTNNVNNTGSKKDYHSNHMWACVPIIMKYLANTWL